MKLAIFSLVMCMLLLVAHARYYEEAEVQVRRCRKPRVKQLTAFEIQNAGVAPGLIDRIYDIARNPQRQQKVFRNREKCLPVIYGYYLEFDLNPYLYRRDAKRIVCVGGTAKWYYTNDHYKSFYKLTDINRLLCP